MKMTGQDPRDPPELVQAFLNGDREAAAQLIVKYAGVLLDHLRQTRRKHGLREADWEDAVHETWVKLIRNPPKFDAARPLEPYLRTVVQNCAIDLAKQDRQRTRRDADSPPRPTTALSGPAQAEQRELLGILDERMAQLTAAHQEALRVFIAADGTGHIVSLANSQGISRGAAQMRYSRAIADLKASVRGATDQERGPQ